MSELSHKIFASLDIGDHVFYGNLGFKKMGGTDEKTAAVTGDFKILEHLAAHVVGRAEGHGGLRADCAVEGKRIAEFFVDLAEIHTFGLNGVKDVDARLHQMGNHGGDEAAGVIGDNNVGVDSLCGADDTGKARLHSS